jgi:spore maturation protein B
MNKILACIVPCIFLFSFLYATRKKVKIYESFCQGAKGAIPLIVNIFPYIAVTMILTQIFQASGLQSRVIRWLSPFFSLVGIPKEIAPLLFMKPLSGSGSIAVLSDILSTYGIDSYIARCACVAYGSSETIFYIGAVYFAGIKQKKLSFALAVSLLSYFLSIILGCFLCRIL